MEATENARVGRQLELNSGYCSAVIYSKQVQERRESVQNGTQDTVSHQNQHSSSKNISMVIADLYGSFSFALSGSLFCMICHCSFSTNRVFTIDGVTHTCGAISGKS